jgi:hypothetical protein
MYPTKIRGISGFIYVLDRTRVSAELFLADQAEHTSYLATFCCSQSICCRIAGDLLTLPFAYAYDETTRLTLKWNFGYPKRLGFARTMQRDERLLPSPSA